jgi:hypothetical protein
MAGKGPLNYTTQIDSQKTASECIAILARHGATRISIDFDAGEPSGLAFGIETPAGMRFYLLPVNTRGVQIALTRAARAGHIPARYADDTAQAQRVGWRVIRQWLDAQLALIDAQLVEIEQVMLPYLVVDEIGTTLYQRYLDSGRKAIGSG